MDAVQQFKRLHILINYALLYEGCYAQLPSVSNLVRTFNVDLAIAEMAIQAIALIRSGYRTEA